MDARRFDTMARLVTNRKLSRRTALAKGSAGLAVSSLGAAGVGGADAQEATPAAAEPPEKIEFLFVQSFQSGSLTPKEGADGTFTLTLEQGLGQTIYFSNRPARIVGATPSATFLEGLGLAVDNPPNAALVVNNGNGETDVAVLELFNPAFDPAGPGVAYDVQVLAEWRKELEVDFHEAPGDLAELPATFGPASLFIDDCPFSDILCTDSGTTTYGTVAGNAPLCWNYSLCMPCEPYDHNQPSACATYEYWRQKCDAAFAAVCPNGRCEPYWSWPMPFWCA